jgi:hypothetical protein
VKIELAHGAISEPWDSGGFADGESRRIVLKEKLGEYK